MKLRSGCGTEKRLSQLGVTQSIDQDRVSDLRVGLPLPEIRRQSREAELLQRVKDLSPELLTGLAEKFFARRWIVGSGVEDTEIVERRAVLRLVFVRPPAP